MGNIDSVPVVAQIKSLVQVIGGDEDGARETQENFIRLAPVAAQINSLVHHIQGNDEEALKIQQEHGAAMLDLAENTPVVGHITAGVYAAQGDLDKAERVAMGATKSTVVAAAGIAGAACGPGAAACGATLAASANAAWDGIDSAVAGENRGVIKQVKDVVDGKTDIGETFDVVAGQGLIAAGGAMGASSVRGAIVAKSGNSVKVGKVAGSYKRLCRRSVLDPRDMMYSQGFSEIPEPSVKMLPSSFEEFNVDFSNSTANPDQLIGSVLSIVMIIKLMIAGHPKSQPYYNEICRTAYPNVQLEVCEVNLMQALQKYDQNEIEIDSLEDESDDKSVIKQILDILVFEARSLTANSSLSGDLVTSICLNLKDAFAECKVKLDIGLKRISGFLDQLKTEEAKIRIRRRVACVPDVDGVPAKAVPKAGLPKTIWTKISSKFTTRHVLDDATMSDFMNFMTPTKALKLSQKRLVESTGKGNVPGKNTFIKASDAARLLDDDFGVYVETTKTVNGHRGLVREYVSNGKVDLIQTNRLDGSAVPAKAYIRYTAKEVAPGEFQVNHMIGPIGI